jgi:hypothetical protein
MAESSSTGTGLDPTLPLRSTSERLRLRQRQGCVPLITDDSGPKDPCAPPPAQPAAPTTPSAAAPSPTPTRTPTPLSLSDEARQMDKRFTDLGQRPVKDLLAAQQSPPADPKTIGQQLEDAAKTVLEVPDKVGDGVRVIAHGVGNDYVNAHKDYGQPTAGTSIRDQNDRELNDMGFPRNTISRPEDGPGELVDTGAKVIGDKTTDLAKQGMARAADVVVPGSGQVVDAAFQINELSKTGKDDH